MADLKHLEHLWAKWQTEYLAGLLKDDAWFVFAKTLVKERARRWQCG